MAQKGIYLWKKNARQSHKSVCLELLMSPVDKLISLCTYARILDSRCSGLNLVSRFHWKLCSSHLAVCLQAVILTFIKLLITTNEPGNCLTPLNCILLLSTRFSPMGTVYKRARDCSTWLSLTMSVTRTTYYEGVTCTLLICFLKNKTCILRQAQAERLLIEGESAIEGMKLCFQQP